MLTQEMFGVVRTVGAHEGHAGSEAIVLARSTLAEAESALLALRREYEERYYFGNRGDAITRIRLYKNSTFRIEPVAVSLRSS